jgi:DNA-binding MarR family transcriptional regulator
MKKLPNQNTIHSWALLHKVQRLLIDKVGTSLKNNDLPQLDWYDVLLELHRHKESGLRQFELCELVLLSKHNLSRLIDRLEKQNLVRRDSCEEDGRGNRIKITSEGHTLLKQMWPIYGASIQEEFGDKLDEKEQSELASLLDKLLKCD